MPCLFNHALVKLPLTDSQPHKSRVRTSEEIAEKTDGESSYSSLQSSFFRTDSCSAEDSDQKNKKNEEVCSSIVCVFVSLSRVDTACDYIYGRSMNSGIGAWNWFSFPIVSIVDLEITDNIHSRSVLFSQTTHPVVWKKYTSKTTWQNETPLIYFWTFMICV